MPQMKAVNENCSSPQCSFFSPCFLKILLPNSGGLVTKASCLRLPSGGITAIWYHAWPQFSFHDKTKVPFSFFVFCHFCPFPDIPSVLTHLQLLHWCYLLCFFLLYLVNVHPSNLFPKTNTYPFLSHLPRPILTHPSAPTSPFSLLLMLLVSVFTLSLSGKLLGVHTLPGGYREGK